MGSQSQTWLSDFHFSLSLVSYWGTSLSITNSQSSLRLTSIESVMPSSHLSFCRPLLLLPPIPPSISVLSNESTLRMRWSKYWSFNFSIISFKEIPGLISFRMDWLALLAVQGTLKRLLQHSSKPSILRHSVFFTGWTVIPLEVKLDQSSKRQKVCGGRKSIHLISLSGTLYTSQLVAENR